MYIVCCVICAEWENNKLNTSINCVCSTESPTDQSSSCVITLYSTLMPHIHNSYHSVKYIKVARQKVIIGFLIIILLIHMTCWL